MGVTLKSNIKLLQLLKTIRSKFKPNDTFLHPTSLLYFYIYFMQHERKKLKCHGTRHCMSSFFCWKISQENNIQV
jgi:hypothetical protein